MSEGLKAWREGREDRIKQAMDNVDVNVAVAATRRKMAKLGISQEVPHINFPSRAEILAAAEVSRPSQEGVESGMLEEMRDWLAGLNKLQPNVFGMQLTMQQTALAASLLIALVHGAYSAKDHYNDSHATKEAAENSESAASLPPEEFLLDTEKRRQATPKTMPFYPVKDDGGFPRITKI